MLRYILEHWSLTQVILSGCIQKPPDKNFYSRSMPVGTVLLMISHGRRPAWPVIPFGRMENVQGLQSWFRSIGLT